MTKEVFERLLHEKQYKAIKSIFDTMNPVDTAALLPEFEDRQLVLLFRLIPKENAANVFTYIEPEHQQILLEAFTDTELENIMDDMFIDDTVDIIEEMPANVVERMLAAAGDKRNAINVILKYPEDSAGSIMTLEYISLYPTMTIGDALKKIKSRGEYSETVNICYVIEKHKLLGTISAMDLLTCDDDELLSDVMDDNPITVNTLADKEDVAQLFNKYDVFAIPVVDKENCMVGIVTVDDAIDVIQEEAEEDFQKMAAIAPTDKPYLKTSVWDLWKVRIPWLLLLMLSATFTGIIISSFEDALSRVVVLTAYIPMLMGTGGNSGSQSSVMVIRGLSLGEVEAKDIFRVF
ncbi:MAG: magnesium transporter, partial [Clostridia bacterium]|nr:magnesium transporter [Clostridia bacterium]